MTIGIIFGGFSREREVSFAGGRTVYDNLNKSLFEAVPIFVDSYGNFVLLDWQYVYKGSIRDFYPPPASVPVTKPPFQIYAESLALSSVSDQENLLRQIGKPIPAARLKEFIDFAFLTLHGPFGEDGKIQGLLEWLEIPYSGSGILSSAIGIDKVIQKELMSEKGFNVPAYFNFNRQAWLSGDQLAIFEKSKLHCGFPLVIKPAHQGSSIGVTVLKSDNFEAFKHAVEAALFIRYVNKQEWDEKREILVAEITDFRVDLGLPLMIAENTIYDPASLYNYLDHYFQSSDNPVQLQGCDQENDLLVEAFIKGKEFSCIVLENTDGTPLALPPTEIRKSQDIYSYRSKYLPGLSRKITPIEIGDDQIRAICRACEKLYTALSFDVYARIDGFISEKGKIFLNDPNTTSGMMPSSFFFHQAAEIGLNPSQFLTYIIYTSIKARIRSQSRKTNFEQHFDSLKFQLGQIKSTAGKKEKVAVLMGGYTSERHISVESGRNVFEKLASSTKYDPVPVFVSGDSDGYRMYRIPVNILLKDNADDIHEKISHYALHGVVREIIEQASPIIDLFSSADALNPPQSWSFDQLAIECDSVFIALHGRPGEDGDIQAELEKRQISYNGSGVESSRLTIDKHATNELLASKGILVASHILVTKEEFANDELNSLTRIEKIFTYPLIAKPCDDGCSSAVKKIKNRAELEAYTRLIFRNKSQLDTAEATLLGLAGEEEFPQKKVFLIEELITARGAEKFMEITGGMLTRYNQAGELVYEIFDPSEALSSGEVLSLEEKFLAGEGQNITPPRYAMDTDDQREIAAYVKMELEKTARILNIEGYCRIDAFIRIFSPKHVEVIIIEANSLPGMTPATAIFHQAALSGYKPYEFINEVLEFAKKKLSQADHA